MKKYRSRFQTITEVEVEAETVDTVTIGGKTEYKLNVDRYHDSYEQARTYILRRATVNRAAAQFQLELAQKALAAAEAL